MIYRTFVAVIVAIVLSLPGIAGSASEFKDLLDQPAMKSEFAAKSMLSGITLAGKRLVAVGWRGHIVYSDDGGKSWTQAVSPVSSDLVAVHFPSAKAGWAVGHDGLVLHSADGGSTWTKQFDGNRVSQIMKAYYQKHPPTDAFAKEIIGNIVTEALANTFLDVWFDDNNNGFIVGSNNMIFQTADGGKSWAPLFDRTDNPSYWHLYSIRRIGQGLFISGEQGTLLKLDPVTGRFRKLKIPYKGTLFGIAGNSRGIVAFGMRGNIFNSTDQGISWRKIDSGISVGLTGATVTKDGSIVVVSQTGDIVLSNNSGLSFRKEQTETPIAATAVVAFNKDTLVLTGFNGVSIHSIKK